MLQPSQNVVCGSSNLLINGEHLDETWSESQWIESGNGHASVTAQSTLNQHNHTVDLSFKSICLASSLTGAGNSPLPATDGDAVGITFVRIESIDGRPSLSHTGFTVSYDQLKRQIVGVLTSLGGVPDRLEPETTLPTSTPSEPNSSEQLLNDSVDDETTKLQYLQNELDVLTLTVHKQKTLVDQLRRPQYAEATVEVKNCHDVKCVAKHIFEKAKSCLHFVIIHLTPKKNENSSEPLVDPDCYWNHSRQARMYAVMKGQKLCSEKPSGQDSTPVSENKSQQSFHQSTSSNGSSSSKSSSSDTLHAILIPVGAVASVLCLCCFTIRWHEHCCNPRAVVERAARREERRTRRQYANLARRHKWRTWWNQRLGRNTQPFSSDYEEKRSLIREQERILEYAMQEQIRQIRNEQGYFDEEAGPDSHNMESLPPYRSRAGSGRPPSYTSQPEPSSSATVVGGIASDVNGGIEDAYPASEITPDSSIANLSRRNSSDTLQTEHSIV